MDIGELVIRIRAVAEDVDSTLQEVQQKVRSALSQIQEESGKPLTLSVKTDGLEQAASQIDELQKKALSLSSTPIAITTESGSLRQLDLELATLTESAASFLGVADQLSGEKIQLQFEGSAEQFTSHLEQMSAALKGISQDAAAAVTEAIQGAVDSTGQLAEGLERAQASAMKLGEAAQAARQAAEAAAQAGDASEKAGEQGVKGAQNAAAATTAWAGAATVLKAVMTEAGNALIGIAVSFIVGKIAEWVNSIAKAREEAEKLRKEHKENALAMEESRSEFTALADEYTALAGKSSLTLDESNRMYEIQSTLRKEFGVTSQSVRGLAGEYTSLAEAIGAASAAQAKQSSEALATVAQEAKQSYAEKLTEAYQNRDYYREQIEILRKNLASYHQFGYSQDHEAVRYANDQIARCEKLIDGVNQELRDSTLLQEAFGATLMDMAGQAEAAGKIIDRALLAAMASFVDLDASAVNGIDGGNKLVDKVAQAFVNAAASVDMEAIMAPIDAVHQKIVEGILPSESEFNEMRASAGELEKALVGGFVAAGDKLEVAQRKAKDAMLDFFPPEANYDSWEALAEYLAMDFSNVEGFTEALGTLQKNTERLTGLKALANDTRTLFTEFKRAQAAGEDTSELLSKLNENGEKLKITFDLTADSVAEWASAFDLEVASIDRSFAQTSRDMETLLGQVWEAVDAFTTDEQDFGLNAESAKEELNKVLRDVEDTKSKLYSSLEGFEGIMERLILGDAEPEEVLAQAQEHIAALTEYFQAFYAAQHEDAEEAAKKAEEMVSSLTRVSFVDGKAQIAEFFDSLSEGNVLAELAAAGLGQYGDAMKKLDREIKSQTAQKQALETMKGLVKQYNDGAKAQKDVSSTQKLIEKTAKAAGVALQYENGQLVNLDESVEDAEKTLRESAVSTKSSIEDVITALQAERIAVMEAGGGTIDVNTEPAIRAIDAAITVLQFFLSLLGQAGLGNGEDSPPKGGGGGGGKDPEAEAEKARKEALEADYRRLEHRRRLNEITYEEELEALEEIRNKHRLNAEEIMDWEEKVYDLKQQIRERDAGSIDKTGDAIITALSNRYQAMLDAEIERLDKSREAWSEWRDESVKAIEDQIDALDELSKTEDREKTDQEELRKIAKLRQDIEFEQDEYNRMKLQQQLDQAVGSREDRLKKQEREDLKDALREEIEAINERADAEIAALDKEQEDLEKAYAERMTSTALRAEAEKMMMSSTQKEMVKLIGEYAPEYDALGKTLGEKLLDGFKNKVGSVVSWFQALNDQLYSIQEAASAEAISAAGAFYASQAARQNEGAATPATVVNQTVNFNEPVESAGETARRIAQTNEELGAILYGG